MPSELKTELVQLRLSAEEKNKLKALAKQRKMAVSVFIRDWINTTPLKPQ
jgi:predicted DNA-binding protein